eukprot:2152868-Amphidinium_carterae.1
MPACGFPAALISSVSKARSKVSSNAPLPTGTSPRPVHLARQARTSCLHKAHHNRYTWGSKAIGRRSPASRAPSLGSCKYSISLIACGQVPV